MKALCSEANCGGVVWARGLCPYHYGKLMRSLKPKRPLKKPKTHPASFAALHAAREARAEAKKADQPKQHPASHSRGFAEFLSEKATLNRNDVMVRLQEQARAQGRPGGIIPWAEIPADPRDKPEIVRLTRVAGSTGFKRC